MGILIDRTVLAALQLRLRRAKFFAGRKFFKEHVVIVVADDDGRGLIDCAGASRLDYLQPDYLQRFSNEEAAAAVLVANDYLRAQGSEEHLICMTERRWLEQEVARLEHAIAKILDTATEVPPPTDVFDLKDVVARVRH